MSQIPSYLRAKTNKYKGDVAEKIALKYLERMNYPCKSYFEVFHDFVVSDEKLTGIERSPIDIEIKKYEQHLKRFKKSLKKYHYEAPPKGLRWSGGPPLTWEEYRERQLEYGKWHIENVKEAIRELKQREKRIKKTWGKHLENIKKYIYWLETYKHKPKYPDFIALREDKAYVIEVKSQTKGKTAYFSKYQKIALEKACDFGLIPMLLSIPVDISIEIGEPKITVVKNSS